MPEVAQVIFWDSVASVNAAPFVRAPLPPERRAATSPSLMLPLAPSTMPLSACLAAALGVAAAVSSPRLPVPAPVPWRCR
jgi:hypothetical protein